MVLRAPGTECFGETCQERPPPQKRVVGFLRGIGGFSEGKG